MPLKPYNMLDPTKERELKWRITSQNRCMTNSKSLAGNSQPTATIGKLADEVAAFANKSKIAAKSIGLRSYMATLVEAGVLPLAR
jgi:hypothetical protein